MEAIVVLRVAKFQGYLGSLDGTSTFSELHEIVRDAKSKLETEVGPVNGVSAKMARGIASRLSVAAEVQRLCSLAFEKADELMASKSNVSINSFEGNPLPAACKFLFEGVTCFSVVLLLIELSTHQSMISRATNSGIARQGKRLTLKSLFLSFQETKGGSGYPISSLARSTIISYTEAGDFGHSEVKCFTKNVEIIHNESHGGSSSAKQKSLERRNRSGLKIQGSRSWKNLKARLATSSRLFGVIL